MERKMILRCKVGLAVFIIGLIPSLLAAQGSVETSKSAPDSGESIDWSSGPSADSVPQWARNEVLRFSRWDGGRIETAKATLSGWPGYWPPNPDIFYATTNWYNPSTVRFLRDAGVNV